MTDVLKGAVIEIADSATDVVEPPSGGQSIITALQIGHVNPASGDALTVTLTIGGVVVAEEVDITAGQILTIFGGDKGRCILDDDADSGVTSGTLQLTASEASKLVAIASWVERT